MLPHITQASRDYHRWKYNEMILETYQMAKKRKETKTMERAATSYAKFNNVNVEDEQSVPYDMIVVQPFTATDDPSVLGIKPIPNIEQKISALIEKYRLSSYLVWVGVKFSNAKEEELLINDASQIGSKKFDFSIE